MVSSFFLQAYAMDANDFVGSFSLDFHPQTYTCKFNFKSGTFHVDGAVLNLAHSQAVQIVDDNKLMNISLKLTMKE